jgi:hypothetical protein
MGYQSDGRWIVKGPVEAVNAAWAELRLSPPEFRANQGVITDQPTLDEFVRYDVGDVGYIRFSYDGWMWYESYPDVQWYKAVWDRLSEHEQLSGRRVRIGENNDDIEDDWFGDEYIELSVSVTFLDEEPPTPSTTQE